MIVSWLPTPAFETRMSTPAKICSACSARRSISAGSVTSVFMPAALTPKRCPISAATALIRSSSRAHRSRCAPSRARPSATASPIPCVAPVTTATLPFSSRSIRVSLSSAGNEHRLQIATACGLHRGRELLQRVALADQALHVDPAFGDRLDRPRIAVRAKVAAADIQLLLVADDRPVERHQLGDDAESNDGAE